ncbi:MAG: molybdenum cofactor sulfurase [Pseudomonadota bacterium]
MSGVYSATGKTFATRAVESLPLSFEGIDGDHHSGMTRRSGGREPWYARGTEMRNERQLTILCSKELAAVANEMGIAEIRPEWIGGNLTIDGIGDLSMLPASTLLFFEGGVTLKVDFQNAPCKIAGGAIAACFPERDETQLSLSFVSAAKRRRGLVAWVEIPGVIHMGETVHAKIPEQWIYRARALYKSPG